MPRNGEISQASTPTGKYVTFLGRTLEPKMMNSDFWD